MSNLQYCVHAKQHSTIWVCHILFTGHVAVVISGPCTESCVDTCVPTSQGVGLLGLMVTLRGTSRGNAGPRSTVATPPCIPPALHGGAVAPTSIPTLLSPVSSAGAILKAAKWCLLCFQSTSPRRWCFCTSFRLLVDHSLFQGNTCWSHCPLVSWIIWFLSLDYKNSLCILNTNPLSEKWSDSFLPFCGLPAFCLSYCCFSCLRFGGVQLSYVFLSCVSWCFISRK